MDFATLQEKSFNPAQVPLSKEMIDQYHAIQRKLGAFRTRLDAHITLMHRARLEARLAAGLETTRGTYSAEQDPKADCQFYAFGDDDQILYSGGTWFRGERDSFPWDECEPLPIELLGASEEAIRQHFVNAIEPERRALEIQRTQAQAAAAAVQEAAERAEFERLRSKFAGG